MTDGVRILDGNTFVVSDRQGDIEASPTDPSGLFSYDTRFISQWVLTIDGRRLTALSVDDLHYWETRFFLVPGMASVYTDSKVSVIRQRTVGDGFREEITILNHDVKPIDLTVRIDADSDFADLFEVKDALAKKGSYSRRVERGRLVLGYERETFRRATVIEATTPAKVDEGGLTFKVRIESHGEWATAVDVTAVGVLAGSGKRGARSGSARRWTCRRASTAGSRRRPGSSATRTHRGRRTTAASSILRRCVSRRRWPAARTCRRPGCRGS